ncbi:hypothetical protein LCGC14_1937250, partial [marine sediment metagenome]
MKWIVNSAILAILVFVMASAVAGYDFDPGRDINLRDRYDIKNAVDIDTACLNLSGDNRCAWLQDPSGIPVHNQLSGLQGGTTDQYYHLNQSIHDTVISSVFSWITSAFFDQDLNTTDSVTFVNVTAGWFKGQFNWTEDSSYLSFDGTTLSFSEANLNNTIDARAGTYFAGGEYLYLNASNYFFFNETVLNATGDLRWILQSNEGNLNVNQSDWWITYDSASDLNNLITLSQANITDEDWIENSQEGDLNVNQSDWWITYDEASDLNNLLTLDWDNITNKFITAVDGVYIYMSGTTVTFNETAMNNTGDARYINVDGETSNISTTGNVTAAYYIGDGSQLHGIQHGSLALFLINNASDISGSKILFTDVGVATPVTLSETITATDTEYQNWTTNDGVPNLHELLDGVNEMHIHARVTGAGTKDTTLLWKLFQNDTSGNMNL